MEEKQNKKTEFKIDAEIAGLFGDMLETEYENLKADIKERGIMEEIIINQDGTIVCGYQRYKIAKELKIPDEEIPYKIVKFENRQDLIEYAVKDNIFRRHMNTFQKARAGLELLLLFEKEAKKRQLAGTSVNDLTKGKNGRALEQAGKMVGLSHVTLGKVRFIMTEGEKKEIQEATNGNISIDSLFQKTKKRKKIRDIVDDNELQKTIIKLDPPNDILDEMLTVYQRGSDPVKKYVKCMSKRQEFDRDTLIEFIGLLLDGARIPTKGEKFESMDKDLVTRELKEINARYVEDMEVARVFTFKPDKYKDLVKPTLEKLDKDESKAVVKLCEFYSSHNKVAA